MTTRKNFPSRVKNRRIVALQQVERRLKALGDGGTVKQRERLEHEQKVLKDRINAATNIV